MLNINEEVLKTILQDQLPLAPKLQDGEVIKSIQLHNHNGIFLSMEIELWYAFTREMRRRINAEQKPDATDALIAQVISNTIWVEYVTKDEQGLTRLQIPTWSL